MSGTSSRKAVAAAPHADTSMPAMLSRLRDLRTRVPGDLSVEGVESELERARNSIPLAILINGPTCGPRARDRSDRLSQVSSHVCRHACYSSNSCVRSHSIDVAGVPMSSPRCTLWPMRARRGLSRASRTNGICASAPLVCVRSSVSVAAAFTRRLARSAAALKPLAHRV